METILAGHYQIDQPPKRWRIWTRRFFLAKDSHLPVLWSVYYSNPLLPLDSTVIQLVLACAKFSCEILAPVRLAPQIDDSLEINLVKGQHS